MANKAKDCRVSWFPPVVGIVCGLKCLLFAAYRSTDFEVHRNWLAITHSLPLSRWYHENTSVWTLDYPPFFAWFEFILSYPALLFDKEMLEVKNLDYASPRTVLFQRLSVIVADFTLIYAVYRLCILMSMSKKSESTLLTEKSFVTSLLILFNFGLLIVDHIHFQYNGFLFGIFLLSIVKIFEGKPFHGAFLFSVLLNFKHIFLYVAPAYFVYLLREECFRKDKLPLTGISRLLGVRLLQFQPLKLGILAFIVLFVFGMSFGPFLYMGDVIQVVYRLFPVKRGLCHAYWAPNFWALYNTMDKALVLIGNKWKLFAVPVKRASMTGGLVAEQEHVVLPSVSPLVTVVVTVLAMLPFLIQMWYKPRGPKRFLQGLILCGYASFLFGYHVHEKAVLLVLIPLSIHSVFGREDARVFLIASTAGNSALFPLLHQPAETPVKVVLYIGFHLLAVELLQTLHGCKRKSLGLPFVNLAESLYIYGHVLLFIYCSVLHSLLGLKRTLPFVPLMLTSIYCAIGILWSWLLFYKSAIYL